MIWNIEFSKVAKRKFDSVDAKKKKNIISKLKELSTINDPTKANQVKSLTGSLKGFFRLRIGNYRIIFSLLSDKNCIAVVNIDVRGNIYK